jgi:hypothetical protein
MKLFLHLPRVPRASTRSPRLALRLDPQVAEFPNPARRVQYMMGSCLVDSDPSSRPSGSLLLSSPLSLANKYVSHLVHLPQGRIHSVVRVPANQSTTATLVEAPPRIDPAQESRVRSSSFPPQRFHSARETFDCGPQRRRFFLWNPFQLKSPTTTQGPGSAASNPSTS